MKKAISHLIFYSFIFLAISCYDDAGTDILFKDTQIEINEATLASGLAANKAYLRQNNGIPKKDSLRINLVGAQRSTPTTVDFLIDGSSTAVLNLHYRLITTGSVQIPANSSFGFIYFEVLADNIQLGEVWTMKVNISNPSVGKVNPNYSSFTRGLQILCPFVRGNFVGTYSTLEPGYGTYVNTAVAITGVGNENSIRINNFWDFGGSVRYDFDPNSATPIVTLPTQNVTMGGQVYVVSQNGAASYLPCSYGFVVPYRVVLNGVTQDTNVHTFTKQ
jgi:hypothetical protein